MDHRRPGMRNDDRIDDKPPYSRIFVVCSKQMQTENLRSAFETFGDIEDIHMPLDRTTREPKGIAYIKYSKTSSAAEAINEMHMKSIDKSSKPLRVMIATNKNDNTSINDVKYKRLFIKVGRDLTENDIRQHFSKFGCVESVYIQKDKATDESRGFAYVYFQTFLDAAKALEDCDKKYKPIFATPKQDLKRSRNSSENLDYGNSSSANHYDQYSNSKEDLRKDMTPSLMTRSEDYDTVCATCSPFVPQKYIEKLFNIIPGMTQFKYTSDFQNGFCKATITYESHIGAASAVEKLDKFEYPSGEILSVKPLNNPLSKVANNLSSIVNSFKNAIDTANPNLMQLADAIAQASTLIKAATSVRESKSSVADDLCSVSLPPPKPMAASSSGVAQRCFIVFKPHPPPFNIIKDAFSRFGDLIDITTFPNKTFGFAKYASTMSAKAAMKTLNGAMLCGIRLKVLEADEKQSKDDNKIIVDEESSTENESEKKRMKFPDDKSC